MIGGRVLVIGGVALFGIAGVHAQAPTFSSRARTVRVDVSVRQGGQPVMGLGAADFEVLDNGVRQVIDYVGQEDTPVNVVLALDMSGSVQGARLSELRTAGTLLTSKFQRGDMGALVTFTDFVSIRSRFTADRNALVSALQQEASGTDTALVDAAHTAMALGESAQGRPLVIVFSDGTDTASFLAPSLALDTARRTGPVVYAVTTDGRRDAFLDDLARLTGGRRLDVSSLERVSDAFAAILGEARQRYLVSYTPTGVAEGGYHELTVRVRGSRAEVRARPGYLAN